MSVDEFRRCVRDSGLPCGLHSGPSIAQTFGCLRLLQFAPGELPVELGIHERHHIDAVDEQAAEEQVVAVDVEAINVDATHRHAAHIGEPDGGAFEARLDEGCACEFPGSGEDRHAHIMASSVMERNARRAGQVVNRSTG